MRCGQKGLVFLRGDYELIANQLRQRRGHFMNPALLQSQFADLEEPHDALVLDVSLAPEELSAEIVAKFQPSS